jgi:uncharacterized membrane protein YkoI
MKNLNHLTIITAVIVSTALTVPVFGDDDHDASKIIPLTEVPASIMNTAKKAVPGIKITGAETEQNDDETIYELKGNADGNDYEIKISPNGKVLKTEIDDEDDDCEEAKDIELSAIPIKVKTAVFQKVPGIKLTEAEVKIKSSGTVYEVEGNANGYDYEIKVTREGNIQKVEKEKPGFFTRLFRAIF